MYTHPDTIEDERTRELYKISHGRYDAGKKGFENNNEWKLGEQKRRNYTWSFSPEKHVFGKRGNSVTNETKWLLQSEIAEGR